MRLRVHWPWAKENLGRSPATTAGAPPARRARLLAAILALLLASCAGAPVRPVQVDEAAPDAASDEAGLLMQMDRYERQLIDAPERVRDAELEAYLAELSCRLAAELCPDIRVYLLRQPFFNAAMAPNGMLILWTGLLLRVEDEAQLAFVLAHEIGHYRARHSLARWRRLKATGNLALAFQVLGAGVGGGLVGAAASMGAYGSLFAFTRDQEREADDLGLARLRELGYEDRRAGELWAAAWEEEKVRDRQLLSAIFATHPASAERRDRLLQASSGDGGERGFERFRAAVDRHRSAWLEDEIARRHYSQTTVLLTRLRGLPFRPAEIAHYQAEMHRRRAGEGDLARALARYDEAIASSEAPAESWRGRGLVLRQLGREEEARADWRAYLQRSPQARDRALIEEWLR